MSFAPDSQDAGLSGPKLRNYLLLAIVCAAFFGMGLLRLNDYSFLTPDSSLYLIWGNAVAHGQGLVDYTQPVPDRFISRGVLYSLLLAPVEYFFPHSLVAAKVFTLWLGVVAIVLFHVWVRRRLGMAAADCAALLLACNPLLFVYTTEVLSEAAFLIAAILIMLGAERVLDREDGNESVWGGFALGLALAAAALLRDIGMSFLIVALCSLYFFSRRRQVLPVLMINVLLLGLWYVRNKYMVHQTAYSQTGYLPWFTSHVGTPDSAPFIREIWWRIKTSGLIYLPQYGGTLLYPLFATRQFASLLVPATPQMIALSDSFGIWSMIVIAASLPCLLSGVYADLRERRSGLFRLAALACYLGIVLCFPFNDIRYHLPLLPVFIFYLISGASFIGERAGSLAGLFTRGRLAIAIFLLMLPNIIGMANILANNIAYRRAPTQPWPAMGAWICANTPEDAIIASTAKDLAPEIGPRKLVNIDPQIDRPEFERLLRDNDVSIVVVPLLAEGGSSYEFPMRESRRFRFDTLHSAGSLIACHAISRLREKADAPVRFICDQSERHAPIVRARSLILAGSCNGALQLLKPIIAADSDRADVLYHMLIAASFLRDTAMVTRCYDRIVALPSWSGIFIAPAQRHMSALKAVIAREQALGIAGPLRTAEAAGMYWRLGYDTFAARLMNETMLKDTSYFAGLLWAMHYNLQSGDTVVAKRYHATLENIDRTNAVVMAFDTILALGEQVKTAISLRAASDIHLHISRIYTAMELPEEALDAAERALGCDSTNDEAMAEIGQRFELRGMFVTADRWYRRALAANPGNGDALAGGLRINARRDR